MTSFHVSDNGSRRSLTPAFAAPYKYSMTALKLRPLHESLGAEIIGLDLSQPLDDATREAVIEAWLEHLILLFREQDLTPETQRAFCEQFAPLGGRLRKAEDRPEGAQAENIMLVTNVRKGGVPIGSWC